MHKRTLVIAITIAILIMCTTLCVFALEETGEVPIYKCDITNDENCSMLQYMFGDDCDILYSYKETENCKYAYAFNKPDGGLLIVYLSKKVSTSVSSGYKNVNINNDLSHCGDTLVNPLEPADGLHYIINEQLKSVLSEELLKSIKYFTGFQLNDVKKEIIKNRQSGYYYVNKYFQQIYVNIGDSLVPIYINHIIPNDLKDVLLEQPNFDYKSITLSFEKEPSLNWDKYVNYYKETKLNSFLIILELVLFAISVISMIVTTIIFVVTSAKKNRNKFSNYKIYVLWFLCAGFSFIGMSLIKLHTFQHFVSCILIGSLFILTAIFIAIIANIKKYNQKFNRKYLRIPFIISLTTLCLTIVIQPVEMFIYAEPTDNLVPVVKIENSEYTVKSISSIWCSVGSNPHYQIIEIDFSTNEIIKTSYSLYGENDKNQTTKPIDNVEEESLVKEFLKADLFTNVYYYDLYGKDWAPVCSGPNGNCWIEVEFENGFTIHSNAGSDVSTFSEITE